MRPFYKSRLFWCGVPGLVFLLWVWWDSGGCISFVRWGPSGDEKGVEVMVGDVVWRRTKQSWSGSAGRRPISVARIDLREDPLSRTGPARARQFDLQPLFRVSTEVYGKEPRVVHERLVRAAFWGVVAGYVVVWLGLVFAWRWRKRRVMGRLTESVMETEVAG
ncbi:hypothetical protein WKV53_14225 [Luteolibacter sp. Y139]|uniref:Transmembrane protein n=1 Tax=Luteolibacter soli TaxID=3135280 RepID=A0ABU9AV83_9BACT